MIDQKLWQKGSTLDEYIEQMDIYQREMQQRIANVYITSAEFIRFKNLQHNTKILVLSEAWCIDCLMNLPIIGKLVEASPIIELKIFDRKKFPLLTDFLYGEGLEKIPAVWVMNNDFSKRGYWMERPEKANKLIERWKNENPEYQLIQRDSSISKEEKRRKLSPFQENLLDEMWNWYDTELQSETVKEIYDQIILNGCA